MRRRRAAEAAIISYDGLSLSFSSHCPLIPRSRTHIFVHLSQLSERLEQARPLMALLREDPHNTPRPSIWTSQGWHQDCTNRLHSVLVRASDSSGYTKCQYCLSSHKNATYEGMVVHRKYSGNSAVTYRWTKFTC